MEIPEKVQKILDKSKVLYNSETDRDFVFWLKPHETYEEPIKINELAPGWEIHIVKGPHIIRYTKQI